MSNKKQENTLKLFIKVAGSSDFWYFFSLIEPIRAPDKHVKLVFLKIRFRGDIREICEFAQANTE